MKYKFGYAVNLQMTLFINFPSLEKQKEWVLKDKTLLEANLIKCKSLLKGYSLEHITEEDLQKIISENNTKCFIDPEFPPLMSETTISK
jgi:hypothetical protein